MAREGGFDQEVPGAVIFYLIFWLEFFELSSIWSVSRNQLRIAGTFVCTRRLPLSVWELFSQQHPSEFRFHVPPIGHFVYHSLNHVRVSSVSQASSPIPPSHNIRFNHPNHKEKHGNFIHHASDESRRHLKKKYFFCSLAVKS